MKLCVRPEYGCIFFLLLAIALTATGVLGQNQNTGEIKGTVVDTSGAVMPDVAVAILNVQTGVTTSATTNAAGIYDVPSIAIGKYTVTFSKPGFRNFVRDGVTLEIQTLAVDGTLQVGSVNEQV